MILARPRIARTPARPGPGPAPPSLLRALELSVRRRVDGLLPGEHRAAALGIGTELAQIRPYVPGDDVRRIDWNVTARTRTPHVRIHVAERAVVTWLLLDTSPSMAFGTADRRKADVAEGVALALGHLATRRGNQLGIATFGDATPVTLPPGTGGRGLQALWGVRRRLAGDLGPEGTGATSLGEALVRLDRLARRRGVIVIVSDFRGPRDWRRPLLRLAGRHQVIAVEIRDPREGDLPDIGEVCFVDPETGRQLRVDTADARLRQRFAAAAAAERAQVARELRAAGAGHVVLSTSGDWLRALATFLRQRATHRLPEARQGARPGGS